MVLLVSFSSVSIFFSLFIFLVYRVSRADPRDGYMEHVHIYIYLPRRYDIHSYSEEKCFQRDEKGKKTRRYYPR